MNESMIFGVSARAILALIITMSCCSVALLTKDINVLKDLTLLALGYYFGQKPSQSITTGGNNATITSNPGSTTVTTDPVKS